MQARKWARHVCGFLSLVDGGVVGGLTLDDLSGRAGLGEDLKYGLFSILVRLSYANATTTSDSGGDNGSGGGGDIITTAAPLLPHSSFQFISEYTGFTSSSGSGSGSSGDGSSGSDSVVVDEEYHKALHVCEYLIEFIKMWCRGKCSV